MMANGPSRDVAALARRAVSDGVLIEAANVETPFCGALIALVLADDDGVVRVSDASVAKS